MKVPSRWFQERLESKVFNKISSKSKVTKKSQVVKALSHGSKVQSCWGFHGLIPDIGWKATAMTAVAKAMIVRGLTSALLLDTFFLQTSHKLSLAWMLLRFTKDALQLVQNRMQELRNQEDKHLDCQSEGVSQFPTCNSSIPAMFSCEAGGSFSAGTWLHICTAGLSQLRFQLWLCWRNKRTFDAKRAKPLNQAGPKFRCFA